MSEQPSKPSAPDAADEDVLMKMAAAIAKQRRADDRAMRFPPAPGDDGPYMPMDMRAARVALAAFRETAHG